MRFEPFIRAPFGYRDLTATKLPTDLLRSFLAPLINDRGIRRDAMKFFGATDTRDTLAAATKLPELDVPALLVWGTADTLFPVSDAERLRDALKDATLVKVPDAKVFVALDQPDAVAKAITEFVAARPLAGSTR